MDIFIISGADMNIPLPVTASIRSIYPQLTSKEKQIADYVLKHDDVIYMSITELVRLSGTGYGSIIRFCKKLGFSGFQEFKIHLAHDLGQEQTTENVTKDENFISTVCNAAIRDINNTADFLSPSELESAARVLSEAETVLVGGVGASAITAMDIEYRLLRLGIHAAAVSDHHMQRIHAAISGKNNAAFFCSFSGSTKDILDCAKVARNEGAKVISLTNYIESPLSEIADINLTTSIRTEPLTSEIASKSAVHTVIDALMYRLFQMIKNAPEILKKTSRADSDAQL